MKTNIILYAVVALLTFQTARAQKYNQLDSLDGYQFRVYYSVGNMERARLISYRVEKAIDYFEKLLDFHPSVTLLILSADDWTKYSSYQVVYGMPHYTGDSVLIVAANDNPFWKSFLPPPSQIAEDLREQVQTVYRTESGKLSVQAFFDLLAIHELGHAFHIQAKLNMQRKWLAELFVNSLLHAYVAEKEPESLAALTLISKMVLGSGTEGLTYTSLDEIETLYYEIGKKFPNNYGWYQFRWHSAAAKIYESSGDQINRRWWDVFKDSSEKISDEKMVSFLESEIGTSVADVLRYWDRDTVK